MSGERAATAWCANRPRESRRIQHLWALGGVLSLADASCAGRAQPHAHQGKPPPAQPAPCAIEVQARWNAPTIWVNVSPCRGPVVVSDNATVRQGDLVATFGEFGVPAFGIVPSSRSVPSTLTFAVTCAHQSRTVELRLEVLSGRTGLETVLPVLGSVASDLEVRIPPPPSR
jgi:hypothetical protein